jgi:flagellar assembly protein FliH
METSLPSVLYQPLLEDRPHLLGELAPFQDPATESLLADLKERAFAAGVAEGRRQAENALAEARSTAESLLATAVDRAIAALATATVDATRDLLELAIDIARLVVARSDLPAGERLLTLLPEVLDRLADDQLVIRAHPSERDLLVRHVGEASRLRVIADATLQTGEAILEGRWARADLTLEQAWKRVREALDA